MLLIIGLYLGRIARDGVTLLGAALCRTCF
jgi:hypothetical protein